MKLQLSGIFKEKGLILTFFLSFVILCIFFGGPLSHPNSVYFDVSGDGMQAYYTSSYHALHDGSFIHFNGMNYPYGENVFFTGCQPTVTGFCKLFGLSHYIVGITNLIMLLSIILCALFLYLIFKELGINYLYAAVCAVAISYISPQIVRIQAHFSLTYQFAIPAFIYFLMRFYKAPSLKKSIIIGVYSFFIASTHLYLFCFFAIISGFYWATLFVLKDQNFKKIGFCLKHFSIQLILPFFLVQLLTVLTDTVHDRTHVPFGFLVYIANWTSVFYPFNKFYEPLFEYLGIKPQQVDSEGMAYVGAVALVISVIFALKLIRDFLNIDFRKFFQLTDNLLLNIFIWSSIFALFYSFAYPFVLGHENWVKHLGFLRQMRALGRFAWIYYYVINITAVYITYKISGNIKKHFLKVLFFAIIIIFYTSDAYTNIRGYRNALNNYVPELKDPKNELKQDEWLNKINIKEYQAIFSLPYFHTGSEMYGVAERGTIKKNSFIVSLKTGLPLLAVNLSRTSGSQSFKNMEMVLEPSEPLKILDDMPDKRPFLVLVQNGELTENEQFILQNSKPLFKSLEYEIYSLQYDTLASLWKKKSDDALKEFSTAKLYKHGIYYSTDSIVRFLRKDYENAEAKYSFKGKGSIAESPEGWGEIIYETIPNILPDTIYSVSFWVNKYYKDLNLRSKFAIDVVDSNGVSIGGDVISFFCFHLKRLEGDWGLIESTVRFKNKNDKIKVAVNNPELGDNSWLEFDELLVKPASTDVYMKTGNILYKNNRDFKLTN